MKSTLSIARTLLWVLASAVPAAASQADKPGPLDSRWLPFLGCWHQLEETVKQDDADAADAEAVHVPVPTEGVIVCVTPGRNSDTATFSTIVENQATFEETIVADGSTQPVGEPGCEGTQRAEWSANGRLFARAQLTCADGTRRTVSGLATMAPGAVWVDIQVVSTGDSESVRVRRYRRSSDQSRVADRLTKEQLALAAATAARRSLSFSLEEVKQAVSKLAPSALEAALVETGAGFPLNARRLQELDAAGVPPRVLDLMVALSFPNRFVVERRTASASRRPGSGSGGGPVGLPWLSDMYDLWPYQYSPFGYGLWGYNDYYFYGTPVYGIGGGVSVPVAPSEHGRVVNGEGYTRVRSRPPDSTAAGGSNGSGGGGGASTGGGSSSGGGGSVSTHGYSGGGGGDGGRTAQPRPPG